ncbi:MAG: transporter substrate-binding protein, partial [Rhodoferax sp.]|nr:transporter substrate-binding protein [Rhodoferax sp.]
MAHPLRVGIVTPAFFYMPTWAAAEKGWYAELGLDVEIIDKGGIDAVTKGLLEGQLDIGIGSPEHVIHNVEAGGPLRMVGGNVNRLTHSLITQPEIRTLEDLRGKTIGVSALSGGTSSLFVHILERAGLKYPGDYTMVEAGPVPPRHKKLMAREIDAGMQTDPHNYMAEDAGLTNLGAVVDWIPYFQFNAINVRNDWAEAHRQVLERFLAASIQASQWVFQHRTEAVAMAHRKMDVERRYAERAWDDHASIDAVPLDLH